jgi:hypothetical protein
MPAPSRVPADQTIADKAAAAAPFWAFLNGRLTHVPTGMTFPDRVGDQDFEAIGISSHHGEGLDDALEWQSNKRESFSTLYLFRPSLADAGIEAAMTDALIQRQYGNATHPYDDRIVAAGGATGVARRLFYEGLVTNGLQMWSGAAFVKVGAWLVEVRVSGPATKRVKLEADIQSLLDNLHFSATTPPHPFHNITFSDCPAPTNERAAVAANVTPVDATAIAVGIMGFDGKITEKKDGRTFQSDLTRVPDRLCRMVISTSKGLGLRLWPADTNAGGFGITRISQFLVLDDAGETIEVSRANKPDAPWYITQHLIGEGRLLAALNAPLSEAQTQALAKEQLPIALPWSLTYKIDAWGKESVFAPGGSATPAKP